VLLTAMRPLTWEIILLLVCYRESNDCFLTTPDG
jgi:hypothetical protein